MKESEDLCTDSTALPVNLNLHFIQTLASGTVYLISQISICRYWYIHCLALTWSSFTVAPLCCAVSLLPRSNPVEWSQSYLFYIQDITAEHTQRPRRIAVLLKHD
jgi:hypothetical protein